LKREVQHIPLRRLNIAEGVAFRRAGDGEIVSQPALAELWLRAQQYDSFGWNDITDDPRNRREFHRLEFLRAERATLPGRLLGRSMVVRLPRGATVSLCFLDSTIAASADSLQRLADMIVNLLHRREPCSYSRVMRSFICRRAT